MLLTAVSRVGCFARTALGVLVTAAALAAAPVSASFVTFESGQVRPLALSPDGNQLFAVNTPDNQLEIFDVDASGLTHVGSVPVGLEPVAVAARTNGEVWVVNHLSDSISIVDVSATPARVVRTLLVGDEPRDIVFAGAAGERAFITTARRGQNVPASVPPLLTTASVPRALVWAFDANNLGDPVTGTPLSIIELFGDTPRALAASPDGSTVYAAVFHSGNQTTTVSEGAVCNDNNLNNDTVQGSCTVFGFSMPGGLPNPEQSSDGVNRPETGLIVKFNPSNNRWEDELGRNWNNAVRFNLPDKDVFAIDADANPPAAIAGPSGVFTSVGTVLFNMVVNPAQPSRVYVTNTEAVNEVRFEGPGILGGSTVRGHLHEARVTVLDGSTVVPRHLNKHINYSVVPSPAGVKDDSLATPVGMAVTSDGTMLYVAAFGSSKIGVFDTAALLNDTFVPDSSTHITVSGGGPTGLVLDEPRQRLYVLTRFDNAVSVIDTAAPGEIDHIALHNPEPPQVVDGRPILYDAVFTSSNGEASCSTCHVFGDFDSLAWDLGNPDDIVLNNPNPFRVPDVLGMSFPDHHPMKGPMTTQSLRGMANHGPMHWRGDRTGGNDPGGDALDETEAFVKFNVAFDGLLGRGGPIPDPDMNAFAAFILEVTYPPNPIRALDNSLTPDETAGRTFFMTSSPSDVFQTCNGCHVLNPAAGFFGSDGFSSFEFETQNFKIAHLRNMYQKVGMFGMPAISFINQGDNGHKGDQVRGFGFLHDGSIDTVFRFHNATVFNQMNPGGFPIPNPGGFLNGPPGDPQRRQVEAFMLAFDSNMAPIVGQQATLVSSAVVSGQSLVAKKMMIKDNFDNDESKRAIVVQSKDAAITIPAAGGADDPRCGSDPPGTVKASITVSSGAGQTHTSNLVCDNWSTTGPSSAPTGYKYRDPELDNGTVSTLTWKSGKLLKLTFKGKGASTLNYDLQLTIAQGTVAVQLQSGAEKYCLQCAGDDGHDGSDGRKFLGKGASCSAPPTCAPSGGGGPADPRVDLLIQRAEAVPAECDLVVKGTLNGEARGWHYQTGPNTFQSDRVAETDLTDAELRDVSGVSGQALTYTCVPPGSGVRIGVDRDEDGFFDRDEIDDGSDPADPLSTP
jgi:DNA-binding beta-propeller fold protein YncE